MLAAVDFSIEEIAIIGFIVGPMGIAMGIVYRQIIANYESQIKSLNEIASTAVAHLEGAANMARKKDGRANFKPLAPVKAEHSSPVTKAQQRTADLATVRARLTAAVLDIGLEPLESEGVQA